MKKWILKGGPVVASFAFLFTSFVANATCILYAYQPELPEEARKLIKCENED